MARIDKTPQNSPLAAVVAAQEKEEARARVFAGAVNKALAKHAKSGFRGITVTSADRKIGFTDLHRGGRIESIAEYFQEVLARLSYEGDRKIVSGGPGDCSGQSVRLRVSFDASGLLNAPLHYHVEAALRALARLEPSLAAYGDFYVQVDSFNDARHAAALKLDPDLRKRLGWD